MTQKIFPTDIPPNQWSQFKARGFKAPACGVVYRFDRPDWLEKYFRPQRTNGMPLGGIDTGCIDLEKNGTLGFMTIFNSHVPRREQTDLPFLGLSVGDKTWILADLDRYHVSSIGRETVYYFAPHKIVDGKTENWTSEDYFWRRDWQVRGISEIHYWGHYPVADMEFDLTVLDGPRGPEGIGYAGNPSSTAPISVGVRAWCPFIPGDMEASLIPGAVFEVHLRNISDSEQKGTLAFTFPGPLPEESEGALSFPRKVLSGKLAGIHVTNGRDIGYVLGVVDQTRVRTGGELGTKGAAWAKINTALPPVAEGHAGGSVAVDYQLDSGEEKILRFILSWYSPRWKGGGTLTAGGNTYTHMYSTRFENALEVANILSEQHEPLLQRILAWQEAIYSHEDFPIWLRESLVNILHLITEDGMWATASHPIGDWCKEEDGLFGLNECPRDCPWMETLPCDFYGNFPLVLFFPGLALSTLRGFKAYQASDGGLPLTFTRTPTIELAQDFFDKYQCSTNGVCYVDLVDRVWQCADDDKLLTEFYPSVKKNVTFTMNLNKGPDGVISAPEGNVNRGAGFIRPLPPGKGLKFGGEHNGIFGMSSHLGGMHLAQLRQAQRMAERTGDHDFAQQCQQWIKQGSNSMETKMWAGSYYRNYWDPASNKKSELIYAYQLVGEWMAHLHGLPGVFDPDRVRTTLQTIKQNNVAMTKYGAAMFARPEGDTTERGFEAFYGQYSMFPSETLLLAATYMFAGEVETGLAISCRHWHNLICRQEYTWEMPNLISAEKDDGRATFGSDYYQNMILWMLPAAMQAKDLRTFCEPGGFVDKIIQAGSKWTKTRMEAMNE
jgi:uncharacterized protein (DUF608 family)